MKKIFLCLGAVSIMTGTSMSMAFSDVVENHWAKDAINSMVDKGIISGYTDGTFRPSRNISKIESLILLSKIAGVNKYPEEASKYETKYASDLAVYNTQYKKQVAYLLGTGVLKKEDLPNLLGEDKLNSPIMREEMAVLITKILGKEDEVIKKSFFILPFEDASTITINYKPYVEFVYNEGVMKGVTETQFSPKSYVTRAQAAIILNSIIEKVNIVPTTSSQPANTGDSNNVDTTNITISISKGNITLVDTILKTIEIENDIFEYDDETKFYVDGKKTDEYEIFEEMKVVEAIVKKGKLVSLNVKEEKFEIDESTGTFSGEIVSINISSQKVITLDIKNVEKSYYLTDKTKYYIDDEKVTLVDFGVGDEVTVTVDKGTITKVVDGLEKEEISDGYRIGTITSIDTDDKKIKIKLKDGTSETIYLATTSKIIDSDGASTKKISKLSKGDDIIAVGEYKSKKYTASVIVLYYE